MKIFLKRPDITSADNKEDEEQSHQPAQPLRTMTDTKSLLSKKTKSVIAKTAPSTAKTSVKTRSKTKTGLNNNRSDVSSSKSASSDATLSPYAATSTEALTGRASSLAANVSSTITTMLSAKLHADASSSASFTSQQASKARGKIREGDASDEPVQNYSMDEIQERTLEVIAAYEEIGNAFKRAAVAVEKLKTILPPGTSIVIPQLPVASEIPENQPPEDSTNTSTDRPSANAASSSASNNASIQNILNDTTSDGVNNDSIWEYNGVNSSTWMNHGDSSTLANKEPPLPDDDGAEEDTSSPFTFRDPERINDVNRSTYDDDDRTLGVKVTSDRNVEIIDDGHFGTHSESLHSSNRKEVDQHGRQNQFDVYSDRIERNAGEPATKLGEDARAESSSSGNSCGNGNDVNNKESKKKAHRSQNPARYRTAPYTISSPNNGRSEPGTFDYSNTNFTDEEIFILEEFNKYYHRRVLTDKNTKQSKVATEISSMVPKVTFEQTAVSKLVRRVKVPKDPATIKALEKWINNERAKEIIAEQED